MKSNVTQTLEFWGVTTLLALTKIVPKSWLYGFLSGVAKLFYVASKKRRSITISNLTHAFPEKNQEEIKKLSKKVYQELSYTLTDILLLLTSRVSLDSLVLNKDESLAKLKEFTKDKDKGIIFIGAHFSNWELPPLFASKYGFPMATIGREGDNKLIDLHIVLPFRQRYGNSTVYKRKAGIAMVKELKNGGSLGMLIDQKVNKENGLLVNFFGREAFTTNSIALLKLKLDPLIIPISMPRIKRGKYRLEIGDPIEYNAQEFVNQEERVLKMTQRYNHALEMIIQTNPSQWFWMHDRWNKRV